MVAASEASNVHDYKSPGRCRLSVKQKHKLKRDLGRNPAGAVFCAVRGLQRLSPATLKTNSRCHMVSGALQLAKRMGFSVRYARPVPYNSATPEEQAEYVTKTIKMPKNTAASVTKQYGWMLQLL